MKPQRGESLITKSSLEPMINLIARLRIYTFSSNISGQAMLCVTCEIRVTSSLSVEY